MKKNRKKFEEIGDQLFEINQDCVKNNNDKDAKSLSCFLLETLERKLKEY